MDAEPTLHASFIEMGFDPGLVGAFFDAQGIPLETKTDMGRVDALLELLDAFKQYREREREEKEYNELVMTADEADLFGFQIRLLKQGDQSKRKADKERNEKEEEGKSEDALPLEVRYWLEEYSFGSS